MRTANGYTNEHGNHQAHLNLNSNRLNTACEPRANPCRVRATGPVVLFQIPLLFRPCVQRGLDEHMQATQYGIAHADSYHTARA